MDKVNCLRCNFRHEDNGNCTAVGGFCTAIPAAHCPLLRKYLDTGLTPEQCETAKVIIESAFSDDTSKAERIRELLKADKDGRVVVLPCQSGEHVFALLDDQTRVRECEVKQAVLDGWRKIFYIVPVGAPGDAYSAPFGAFGKTVFLTREEAEAALKERRADHEAD